MKALPASLALAAASAIVLLGAAPAHAAGNTIDPGDELYSFADDSNYNDWQFFSVDSTTAFSTPIGEGSGVSSPSNFSGQPAYDATTGVSYFIQYRFVPEPGEGNPYVESYLATIDPTTGVSTPIGEFFGYIGEDVFLPFIDAIAIGPDGEAFAISNGGDESPTGLYELDLTDGYVQFVDNLFDEDVYAFAADPTSGLYYLSTVDGAVFTVTASGDVASAGTIGITEGQFVFSLQIDEAGTFWIAVLDEESGSSLLFSFPLGGIATPVLSGVFTDDPYYTQAILIIPGEPAVVPEPEPALAATGSTVDGVVAATGIAGILALVGAALLVARRRTV